ncbi:nucleotidyltransferase [Peribacillus sp. SI8-4]|uniref:nucleotidyltransferase n=1 Tax=Peribacillus sp. SI8-4 TaxID=3048009 RepID=UPI002556C540|nr:nucleotidyltransferase [Peribacillus sp. SI8-4]
MKACGLVVEYNPFHNGHVLHARKSREETGADIVVAVMSGPFLQRGEPALVSKWARAAMALQGGIDLVIELPYAFATQKAEIFARGSIALLEYIGCGSFCFGSEDGRIDPFITAHKIISDRSAPFNDAVKLAMEAGNSYPASAAMAYQAIIKEEGALDLTKPNNILGKEYVSAAFTNGFSIRPYTIQRVAAGFHDTDLSNDSIASATGIRKAIHENQGKGLDSVSSYVPHPTRSGLEQYLTSYRSLHDWEMYWPLLKYRILSTSLAELATVYEIEEGIEHRIKQMAKTAVTFSQFMTALKTKRYTWTRLQRMCVHILTHTLKEQMADTHLPTYFRLLGMNGRGREYLHTVKKNLPLPLISKLSAHQKEDIEMDVRAAQVYALGLSGHSQASLMEREYAAPIII